MFCFYLYDAKINDFLAEFLKFFQIKREKFGVSPKIGGKAIVSSLVLEMKDARPETGEFFVALD